MKYPIYFFYPTELEHKGWKGKERKKNNNPIDPPPNTKLFYWRLFYGPNTYTATHNIAESENRKNKIKINDPKV